jgi:hypothetical protein
MLGYQFFLGWEPGPSVNRDLLNHITPLRLENVTFKYYGYALMPISTQEDTHTGMQKQVYTIKL